MTIWQIKCAYNGANFKGWSRQPGQITIQETLETTYRLLFGENVNITAASRTDKAVHALAQIIRWKTAKPNLPPLCIERWQQKLPLAIRLKKATLIKVIDQSPSLRHAVQKTYRYIINDQEFSVFNYDQVLFYDAQRYPQLTIQDLQKAANCFIGTHDFTLFSRIKKGENINPIRTVNTINICRNRDQFLEITFIGPNFIRHQIRFMVGAMIAYCQKQLNLNTLKQQLTNHKQGQHSQFCVSGKGLFLVNIQLTKPCNN